MEGKVGYGDLQKELKALADPAYRNFQARLMPTVDRESILGVRMPALRKFARHLVHSREAEAFLQELPHAYYDENNLHGLLINELTDYEAALKGVKGFLPFVDNWATCDLLAPKGFQRQQERLYPEISGFLKSDHTYTVRFGLGLLMRHFLGEAFAKESMELAAACCGTDYYVNMGIAWYFATALDRQPEAALDFLQEGRLNPWVHNKTIQKARESFRISPEMKTYLKKLRISSGMREE